MRDNRIQFAVVREDPMIEADLVEFTSAQRALLIGSGGCTALTLQAIHPQLELTLVDMNVTQLGHIDRKANALLKGVSREAFNIESDDPQGLNACGNFESLFRGLRDFIFEFVADREEMKATLLDENLRLRAPERLFSNKYWPVAFDLYFSDSLLNAMFGPDATQHAPRGSYPGYFRRVVERGLLDQSAAKNYFLHHVLLGQYLEHAPPEYFKHPVPPKYRFKFVESGLEDVTDFGEFELISLSNIFDWMGADKISRIVARICATARPGTAIVYRQLNHTTDFRSMFEQHFEFDRPREARLHAADRSLFYSKLNIGVRRGRIN